MPLYDSDQNNIYAALEQAYRDMKNKKEEQETKEDGDEVAGPTSR